MADLRKKQIEKYPHIYAVGHLIEMTQDKAIDWSWSTTIGEYLTTFKKKDIRISACKCNSAIVLEAKDDTGVKYKRFPDSPINKDLYNAVLHQIGNDIEYIIDFKDYLEKEL